MDTERLLIDKLAYNGNMDLVLSAGIRDDHFVKEDHQEIFLYMTDFFRQYKSPASIETLRERFPDHLFEINTHNVEFLKDQQLKLIKRRAAMSAIRDLADAVDDPDLVGDIDSLFLEKSRELTQLVPGSSFSHFRDMPVRIEDYEEGKGLGQGIEMGIPEFDFLTSGIQPHEYITISGFSGTGKSTLAQHILFNAYMQGKTPMYISLEMEAQALFRKWDTMMVNFEYNRLKRRRLTEDDIRKWKEAAHIVANNENDIIVMDDVRGCTVDRVYAELIRYEPDLLCIDYVSLMDTSRSQGKQMWEKVTYLTQALKATARTLKIPIIGVAQTNRSGYNDGARMDNMAFSQSIVNDSDIILGLNQDEEMKEQKQMEVRLLKNRDGQTGETQLLWKMDTMEFRPWVDAYAFSDR